MIQRVCLAVFGIVCFHCSTSTAEQLDVWFGTTTPRNGTSQGIYHARFDTDKGKFSSVQLAAEVSNPGFLAIHPKENVLYSTGTVDGDNVIVAYRIDRGAKASELTLIGKASTGDGGAAHVSTDRAGKVLLSAQYGGGSTSLYQLADDGNLVKHVQTVKHDSLIENAGSGVVPNRQDSPHAHWCGTSPDDRFVFVPDLGMDKVVIFELDQDSPGLQHHGFGVAVPGAGPRHMKFSVDGKQIYLLNELLLSVTVFDYDAETGKMTAIQTIPTLSEEVKAKETFNSASEIRVHPSGKYVYTANRGHDSITAFRVNDAEKLDLIEVEAIRGGWPRNFNITPDGKWLIAAGRDSHTATVFSIDAQSGELTFQRETATVPSPICVVFGRN